MNPHLQRARLLFEQSRYELADQEIRRSLAEMPHDPEAHALLALCLVRQEKLDEAQSESEQAIVIAPDWAFTHHVRSVILEHRNRFAEAEAAAREAIALDPFDADYRAHLASTLFAQERWREAYDQAMEGLAHDAENAGCNHFRTMALTKLGRQSEAISSVDEMLRRAPEDAMAHANKGWAELHQGRPRQALEHFRESLRLDPTSAYARAGIVEALKARNPLYRWMLAYFLWMSRLSNGARWAVIVGGYIGVKTLNRFARANPDWTPWIYPVIAVYVAFALLTWFAVPLFNLMLRFNKFGWYALSRDQRVASNWFGACLALFVAAAVYTLLTYELVPLVTAAFALGMALPLVTIYSCDVGWPRQAMTAFAAVMALAGLGTIVTAIRTDDFNTPFFPAFMLGFIATPWLANYLATATPKR